MEELSIECTEIGKSESLDWGLNLNPGILNGKRKKLNQMALVPSSASVFFSSLFLVSYLQFQKSHCEVKLTYAAS